MRTIKFYNQYHLGDCIYHIHYLINCLKINDDIEFIFYINPDYINELNQHLGKYKDKIKLMNIQLANKDSYNSWIQYENRFGDYMNNNNNSKMNDFYSIFFDLISNDLNIENPIKTKNDMLSNNELILNDVNFGDFDILFINSQPMSGQFDFFGNDFNEVLTILKRKYKIITTAENIFNLPYTMKYKLNIMNIGNIATKVKYIIGINTAPTISCFNIWNNNSVEKWLLCDKYNSYSYNDRIIKVNNLNELSNEVQKIM